MLFLNILKIILICPFLLNLFLEYLEIDKIVKRNIMNILYLINFFLIIKFTFGLIKSLIMILILLILLLLISVNYIKKKYHYLYLNNIYKMFLVIMYKNYIKIYIITIIICALYQNL